MKFLRSLIPGIILANVMMSSAYAEMDMTSEMVNARDHIQGLEKVLNQIKKETHTTPAFPEIIPKTKKTYYANYDTISKQSGFNYMINVDSTPDCNGVKYCNVGSVSSRPDAKPDMMTDKNNKKITVTVDLADGTQAYYTPGHAMGDYFPASIQWVDNNVLYMISWNGEPKSEKMMRAALITMANSAKHPGSG